MTIKCDVAVIGGGIIGTSIARKLKLNQKHLQVLLVEKERYVGKHQTSHNSGVMHCGVYYKPESLKAKFCSKGIQLLKDYCTAQGICYKNNGKLIVAKDCSEVDVLDELCYRGRKNKVGDIQLLESQSEIQKIASGCRGIKALWCPETANVDFKLVAKHFLKDFQEAGGQTQFNTNITNIVPCSESEYPLNLISKDEDSILSKFAITCGGLHADTLTKLIEKPLTSRQQFISLKVDYQQIKSRYCVDLSTNIYPVPDLKLPFLGAHFSPHGEDTVLLGPYAVPALKIDGYSNDELNLTYLLKVVTSCGFRNMFIRNFSKCITQASKALCNEVQIKDLQQLIPNMSYQHIQKGPTAVQGQLLQPDGTFVDDFIFDIFASEGIGRRIINIKFTPSPAATSCLAIADYIVGEFGNKSGNC